jgi:hypothetical protein
MSLNLDIGVVRAIGVVIVLLGIGGWWYAVKYLRNRDSSK